MRLLLYPIFASALFGAATSATCAVHERTLQTARLPRSESRQGAQVRDGGRPETRDSLPRIALFCALDSGTRPAGPAGLETRSVSSCVSRSLRVGERYVWELESGLHKAHQP